MRAASVLWGGRISGAGTSPKVRADQCSGAPRGASPHRCIKTFGLLIFFQGHVQQAATKELKYPEGIKPGDQVSGSAGEYFRYKHVLVKPPDDNDRLEALQISKDIQCKACEVLLQNLLGKAESFTEDHIMDQLDGDIEGPIPDSDNPQEDRVNRYRKGCNKHFKDDLLLRGWTIQKCPDIPAAGAADSTSNAEDNDPRPTWCLEQGPATPTERDVDTYSVRSEAVFYACEATVARYGHELAAFLAERLEDGGAADVAVQAACRQAATCAGRKRRPEERRKSGRRKRRARQDDL